MCATVRTNPIASPLQLGKLGAFLGKASKALQPCDLDDQTLTMGWKNVVTSTITSTCIRCEKQFPTMLAFAPRPISCFAVGYDHHHSRPRVSRLGDLQATVAAYQTAMQIVDIAAKRDFDLVGRSGHEGVG